MLTNRLVPAALAAAALVLPATLVAPPASAATPSPAATGGGVIETPISFLVRNVNRSVVACPADDDVYRVEGDLVSPEAPADLTGAAASTATLYLHGLGLGEFFWDFKAVPGYDFAAAEAKAGQTSVIVNRLGYGSSGRPPGNELCLGSQADVAHQMVQDLHDGDYTLHGGTAPQFPSVVLAGHSFGAFIAQIEAYSFGDISGLINMSYSDSGTSKLEMADAAQWKAACSAPGSSGYEPFAQPAKVPATFFHGADPAIVRNAVNRGVVDPCGDETSSAAGVAADLAHLSQVNVPVLVLAGADDALFPPPDGQTQAARFTGSPSVTLDTVAKASHAVTLEPARHVVASDVADWLATHIDGAS